MVRFYLVMYFVIQFTCSDSAKILGIVPTPSYSHQVPFQPIWRELSLRGHQVTVLTTDPINDPTLTNLTEIDFHYTYNIWQAKAINFTDGKYSNPFVAMNFFYETLLELADTQLQDPQVKKLINDKNQHFDLVIVEYFLQIMYAFGERYKCPVIGMVTVDVPNYILNEFGNPTHPALNHDALLPYTGSLTFFQRINRVLFDTVFPIFTKLYVPAMEKVIHKHFGDNFPKISELSKRITMLFSNGNQIFGSVKPLVPAIIEIGGGIHIKPLKHLPSDLKKFLDDAKDGFVYFSLGSNVKSKDLSSETKKVILETFSEIPYKVLWKFEDNSLPDIPKKVLISKWLPQQDVLRHPNIKLFISQGGYQSTEEALHCKVPILGIPFLGDQQFNVNVMVSKGVGLKIEDSSNITKSELKTKILEITQNLKYRNKVVELSNLIMDQPMTGLEKAIWWSEYVIRHKGAEHLRSPALDLPTYQYYLLDVIGFCVAVIILTVYLIVKVAQIFVKLCKYLFSKKTKLE